MLPTLSVDDLADDWSTYSEQSGQLFARECASSDCQDVGLSEFGPWAVFAGEGSSSFVALPHIGVMVSEMEMFGVNADLAVTVMQDKLTLRDRLVIDPVRGLMGPDMASTDTEDAVSVCAYISGPVPTSFSRWITRHMPGKGFGFSEVIGAFVASSCGGISMSLPSLVMAAAPVSSDDGSVTSVDRADHPVQYSEVSV